VYGTTYNMPIGAGRIGLSLAGSPPYASLSWKTAGTAGVSLQVTKQRPDILLQQGVTWSSFLAISQRSDQLLSGNYASLVCPGTRTYGASGQMGTPGTTNSSCLPWTVTPIPGAFQSIAATGKAITNLQSTGASCVDCVDSYNSSVVINSSPYNGRAVKVGNTLYGTSTNRLYVDSNGWIGLVATPGSADISKTLPSGGYPLGDLAVWWDDLEANPVTNSAVYIQQFDPNGIPNSGDEYTLISWENWRRKNAAGSNLNFQIKFLEGSGNMEFHYGTMTSTDPQFSNGANATIWMESTDGKNALPASVHQPNMLSNSGFRWTWTP
jgi:hypothetical protein